MIGKTWMWWQLWLAIKPKLRSTKFAEIKASLEAKTAEAEKKKEQGSILQNSILPKSFGANFYLSITD
jgi:hypothetical protein